MVVWGDTQIRALSSYGGARSPRSWKPPHLVFKNLTQILFVTRNFQRPPSTPNPAQHDQLTRPAQSHRHHRRVRLCPFSRTNCPAPPRNTFLTFERCLQGDFATIAKYKPQDATTNPTIILSSSKKPESSTLIDNAIAYAKRQKASQDLDSQVDAALDCLLVEFGKEILKVIPGRVSTEIDARFSFDTKASVDKALHIINVRFLCNRLVHR